MQTKNDKSNRLMNNNNNGYVCMTCNVIKQKNQKSNKTNFNCKMKKKTHKNQKKKILVVCV